MKTLLAVIAICSFTLTRSAQWTTGTSPYVYLTTSGNNVGIGITNPLSKLVVAPTITEGTINSSIAIMTGTGQTAFGGYIGQRVVSSNTRQGLVVSGTGSLSLQAQAYNLDFITGSANPTDDTNLRMRILGNGNIGVGTPAPSEKLEVSGGFVKSGTVSIGNNGTIGAKNYVNLGSDNNGSFLVGSNIYVTNAGGATALKIANTHSTMSGAGIMIPGNGQNFQSSIMFHTSIPGPVTADAAYSSCRMIINEHGKVGIGTTSPDQLLTVNGTIHSKSVVVDLSVVPDYVFKPTYKLPNLAYLKNYINKNSHLPEVPCEAEIKKNGLDVGEMNAVLLKKVEELTLYMIEKDKQIKHLQTQVKELQKHKK